MGFKGFVSLTGSPKINLEQVTKGLNVILEDTTATSAGRRNVQNEVKAFVIFLSYVKMRYV